MRIRMLQRFAGLVDGRQVPPVGTEFECADDAARNLVRFKVAEVVEDGPVEPDADDSEPEPENDAPEVDENTAETAEHRETATADKREKRGPGRPRKNN